MRCSASACATGYRGWEAAVFTGNPALGRELGINARRTPPHDERPDRMPAAAALDRSPRSSSSQREPGRAAGDRRRRGARAARARRCSRTACARTSTSSLGVGASARRFAATACTTPTCPSTPSRSTSTSPIRRGTAGRWLYVQEYAPPATIDATEARARREEAISDAAGGPRRRAPSAIYWRTRRPQKGKSQYESVARRAASCDVVEEGGLKFLVNFTDYLDTGLFLDHRPTRARIRAAREGQALPEPLLLHRRRDGVRGRGRRRVDDEHRHVAHLSRLGEAQPLDSTGFRGEQHASCRRTASPGSRRPTRSATTSSSSTRRRSRTPSAWTTSSTCSATTWTSSARR